MPWWSWIIVAAVLAAALALAARAAGGRLAARVGGTADYALASLLARAYCRLVHRVEWIGLEHVPDTVSPGPLVIVSNHSAGVDPVLIASGVRFRVRWMMAGNFMAGATKWFWDWLKTIPVARDGRDSGPLREAVRHVRAGGVIGLFPEGGIVTTTGELRAFLPGAGFIIHRARAPVLLVWITGTPKCDTAFGSLTRFSRARVEFLGLFDLSDAADPGDATARLRAILAARSGWRLNDEPVPTARQDRRPPKDPFAA